MELIYLNSILGWYFLNKNKFGYPWNDDLTSRRFINMLYNYEFINSSSTREEKNIFDNIIYLHMHRLMFDFKYKKVSELIAFDLIAHFIKIFIIKKFWTKT